MPEFRKSQQRLSKPELIKVPVNAQKGSKPLGMTTDKSVILSCPKIGVNGKVHTVSSEDPKGPGVLSTDHSNFVNQDDYGKPYNPSSQENGSEPSVGSQHKDSFINICGDVGKFALSRLNQSKEESNDRSSNAIYGRKTSLNVPETDARPQKQSAINCSRQAKWTSPTPYCGQTNADHARSKFQSSSRRSGINSSENHITHIHNSGKDKINVGKQQNSVQNRKYGNASGTTRKTHLPFQDAHFCFPLQSPFHAGNTSLGNIIPSNTFPRTNFSGNNLKGQTLPVRTFPYSSHKSQAESGVQGSDSINSDHNIQDQEPQSTSEAYQPVSVSCQINRPTNTGKDLSHTQTSHGSHTRNKSWPRRNVACERRNNSLHPREAFNSPTKALKERDMKDSTQEKWTSKIKLSSLKRNESVETRKNNLNKTNQWFNAHNSRYDQFKRNVKQVSIATNSQRNGPALVHAESQVGTSADLTFQPIKDKLYQHSKQPIAPQGSCYELVTKHRPHSETRQNVYGQTYSKMTTNNVPGNSYITLNDTFAENKNQCKESTNAYRFKSNLLHNLNSYNPHTASSEITTLNHPRSAYATNRYNTFDYDMNSSCEGTLVSVNTVKNTDYREGAFKANTENMFRTFTNSTSQTVPPFYDPSVHQLQLSQNRPRFTHMKDNICNQATGNETRLNNSHCEWANSKNSNCQVSNYWSRNNENGQKLLDGNKRTIEHKNTLNGLASLSFRDDSFGRNILNNEHPVTCGSNFKQTYLVDMKKGICAEGNENHELNANEVSFRNEIDEEMARAQEMSIPVNVDTKKNLQSNLPHLNPDANEFSPVLRDNQGNSSVMTKKKGKCFLSQVDSLPAKGNISTDSQTISDVHLNEKTQFFVGATFESNASENYSFQSFNVGNMPHAALEQNGIWQDSSLIMSPYVCPNDLFSEAVPGFDVTPTVFCSTDAHIVSPYFSVFNPECAQGQSCVPPSFVYPTFHNSPGSTTYVDHLGVLQMNFALDPMSNVAQEEHVHGYTQTSYASPCYSCSYVPMYFTPPPVTAAPIMQVSGNSEYCSFIVPTQAFTGDTHPALTSEHIVTPYELPVCISGFEHSTLSRPCQSGLSQAPVFNFQAYYDSTQGKPSENLIAQPHQVPVQESNFTINQSKVNSQNQHEWKMLCKDQGNNVTNDAKFPEMTKNKTNVANKLDPIGPILDKTKNEQQSQAQKDNSFSEAFVIPDEDTPRTLDTDKQRKIDVSLFKECKAIIEKLKSRKIALDLFQQNFSSEPVSQQLEMKKWLKLALQIIEFNENTLTVDQMVDVLLKPSYSRNSIVIDEDSHTIR